VALFALAAEWHQPLATPSILIAPLLVWAFPEFSWATDQSGNWPAEVVCFPGFPRRSLEDALRTGVQERLFPTPSPKETDQASNDVASDLMFRLESNIKVQAKPPSTANEADGRWARIISRPANVCDLILELISLGISVIPAQACRFAIESHFGLVPCWRWPRLGQRPRGTAVKPVHLPARVEGSTTERLLAGLLELGLEIKFRSRFNLGKSFCLASGATGAEVALPSSTVSVPTPEEQGHLRTK